MRFFLYLLFFCTALHATEEAVTVYGDIMEGFPDGVRIVKGNLKAVQPPVVLTGEWGKYYENTEIVEAYGSVRIDDPGYYLTCGMVISYFSESRGIARQNPVVIEKVPMLQDSSEVSGSVHAKERYLKLSAREITSFYREDRIVASDNVTVEEHLFPEFMTPGKPEIQSVLTSNTLEMFLKENRSIARGNVCMKTSDITASGEEAVFYHDEEKLIITGNAKALQNVSGSGKQNQVTGEKIVYFLKTGRTVVLKARADVFPSGSEGAPGAETQNQQNR